MTLLKKLVTTIALSSTIGLSSMAYANEDTLILVPLPLDTQQGKIAVFDVPFIIGTASPETEFSAIGLPYIPPTISPHKHGNINLASIAGIKVKPSHESGRHYRIELDYAEVKEVYRTEKLLSAVLDCVYRVASRGRGVGYSVKISITNLDSGSELHGTLKRLIKIKGEQVGAVQPATAPESKSKGKEKSPLEGIWKGHEIWEGKKKEPAKTVHAMKMEFRANQVTILKDGMKITGLFDFDKTKLLNLINIHLEQEGHKMTIPAIYKIEGDIFTLCHADDEGGKRPTSFNVKEGVVVASFVKVKLTENKPNNKADQPATAGKPKAAGKEKPKFETKGPTQ